MSIGSGIAIAGMWLGVGVACFATQDAVVGFLFATGGTVAVALFSKK